MALTIFPFETDKPKIDVTLPIGTHVLELIVKDDQGKESAPDTVTITVQGLPLPTITGFTVDEGNPIPGATNVKATITGTNLEGVSDVIFYKLDGTVDADVTVTNLVATPNHLSLIIKIGADPELGDHIFSVSIPGGDPVPSGSVVFRVVLPPQISSISKTSGIQGENIGDVTISGMNLDGATAVTFSGSGIKADITGRANNKITITIHITSDALPGSRTISVTTPGGKVSGLTFRVEESTNPEIYDVIIDTDNLVATISGKNLKDVTRVAFEVQPPNQVRWSDDKSIAIVRYSEEPQGMKLVVKFRLTGFPSAQGDHRITIKTASGLAIYEFPHGQTIGLGSDLNSIPTRTVDEVTGIDPVMKARLEKAGITTLSQLASMEPANLVKVSGLTKKQVTRLIDSAKKLLNG